MEPSAAIRRTVSKRKQRGAAAFLSAQGWPDSF